MGDHCDAFCYTSDHPGKGDAGHSEAFGFLRGVPLAALAFLRDRSFVFMVVETENTAHLLLSGLARAAVYHVRISARNEFGWKQSDQEFVFGTKGSDGIFKAAMTAGGGTTSF